jgi:hypothetical protein
MKLLYTLSKEESLDYSCEIIGCKNNGELLIDYGDDYAHGYICQHCFDNWENL